MACRQFNKHQITAFFLLSILLVCGCSVRSVQIKRAEQRYKKGQILAARGETERAIASFNKSIAMARGVDYMAGVANNLNELAIIYTRTGEYGKARELLTEMITIYRDLDMKAEVSKSMNNLAMTYVSEKQFQKAFDVFDELMAWDKETGNELGIAITLFNMAKIYHQRLGMTDKANECLYQALRLFKETGNEDYIRMIQENMQKK